MSEIIAKKLPRSSSFPRYVRVGEAVCDCARDSRGMAVRLSTRLWISTQRWNEIAYCAGSLDAAKTTALTEAKNNRARGKAAYANICVKLDAIDHPGFQSRRTTLAVHAAQIDDNLLNQAWA